VAVGDEQSESDEAPPSLSVAWQVDGLTCTVRDATWRQLAERAAWWLFASLMSQLAVLAVLTRDAPDPTNWLQYPRFLLLVLAGTAVATGVEWTRRRDSAHGAWVMAGTGLVAAMVLGAEPLPFWGSLLAFQAVYGAVLGGHYAIARIRPTQVQLTAKAVRVGNGPVTALEGMDLTLDGRFLVLGSHRLGLGGHAEWERLWLIERLRAHRRQATCGEDRAGARRAVEGLVDPPSR